MSLDKRGISTALTAIIIISVVSVAGFGAFAYVANQAMPHIFSNQNEVITSQTTVQQTAQALTQNHYTQSVSPNSENCSPLVISGVNLDNSYPISCSESASITCNNCDLTLNLQVGITANILVSGSNNDLIINGGNTNLQLSGSNNDISASNTNLLSNQDSGTNNNIS